MICVLCDGRAALPDGAEREYNSYCGTYTFDGARLVTCVDATAKPDATGGDQVRDVRFEGGLMVLRPPVRGTGPKAAQRELFFEKISDV